MQVGDYGLTEVDIKTHCSPCNRLFKKQKELQNRIECCSIEMKGHLREYRQLKKNKDAIIQELLDLEYMVFQKHQPENQLFYMSSP